MPHSCSLFDKVTALEGENAELKNQVEELKVRRGGWRWNMQLQARKPARSRHKSLPLGWRRHKAGPFRTCHLHQLANNGT